MKEQAAVVVVQAVKQKRKATTKAKKGPSATLLDLRVHNQVLAFLAKATLYWLSKRCCSFPLIHLEPSQVTKRNVFWCILVCKILLAVHGPNGLLFLMLSNESFGIDESFAYLFEDSNLVSRYAKNTNVIRKEMSDINPILAEHWILKAYQIRVKLICILECRLHVLLLWRA